MRFSVVTGSRPAVKRLGKIRGAVLDALEASGGSATIQEIAAALHRSRPWDLVRRKKTAKGRDGALVMLEEAGIISVDGDTVILAADWLERLEGQRQVEGELDVRVTLPVLDEIGAPTGETREHVVEGAETITSRRQKIKSEAFRRRLKIVPDPAPTEEEMRERRESGPYRREDAIRTAIARLFAERPEYRSRRVGQVTCALPRYLPADFSPGQKGLPKDAEVEAILEGVAA